MKVCWSPQELWTVFRFLVWFQVFMFNWRSSHSCIWWNCWCFTRSGVSWAVTLDISKVFDTLWHAGLGHKLRSDGITGRVSGLIFLFLNIRELYGSGWEFLARVSALIMLLLEPPSDVLPNIASVLIIVLSTLIVIKSFWFVAAARVGV